jgi:hypothetical protein
MDRSTRSTPCIGQRPPPIGDDRLNHRNPFDRDCRPNGGADHGHDLPTHAQRCHRDGPPEILVALGREDVVGDLFPRRRGRHRELP